MSGKFTFKNKLDQLSKYELELILLGLYDNHKTGVIRNAVIYQVNKEFESTLGVITHGTRKEAK